MRYLANTRYDNCASERGAVFFYILLAVALFAALSYAVSRNNRGSVSILSDQQAKLAAQEIIEYGNTVAAAVQKLRLRGVADNEISFENNVFKRMNGELIQPSTIYPNCTTDECKIFSQKGGNINPYIPPKHALVDMSDFAGTTFYGPGVSSFAALNVLDIGTDEIDLTLRIPGIKTEICIAINNLLNIENPDGKPPLESIGGWREYNNNYTGTGTIGNESPVTKGKLAFCGTWYGASLGDERESKFYQVLIAR